MTEENPIAIHVKHRFSASAERVFDAWLDPEKAAKFLFATPTGRIVRVDIDARAGGRFTVVDRRNGENVAHTGTYLKLDRPRRIAFSFVIEKYSAKPSRVTIDIHPRDQGCEVTLTQELDRMYSEFEERTKQGWAKMLEAASLLVVRGPETCGAGLAQHSELPARLAPVFAALAETLELHRGMLVPDGPNTDVEDEAYRELAQRYRDIAGLVEAAAERMAACRDLPLAEHDESAFGKPHLRAFERFVQAQNELLALLKIAAERDERMLDSMTGSD